MADETKELSDTVPVPGAMPCPFCGSRDIHNWASTEHGGEGKRAWSVMCFGCETEGPHVDDAEAAIRLWNERAADPRIAELDAEIAELRASLTATKGHATRAKNEAAVLRAEKSPVARRVGRPRAAFGKPGEPYSPELAAIAIAGEEDVEIVFSDGKDEIVAIAPLRVRGDAWLMTGGRHMLREPVEIEGGEAELEIAGFAMLSGGEQIGWRELPEPVRVPKNGRVRLENCITF